MTSRLWVYSGARPSNSAKELAAHKGFLRLRDDRLHKLKVGDKVINWGVSTATKLNVDVLNQSCNVKIATDKLQAFIAMQEAKVYLPDFTDQMSEALDWCLAGHTVVVRNKLTGHSGDGIIIIEKGTVTSISDMMKFKAPLYTRYVYKVKEYRVHVVAGKVIDTQQKIKDPDQEVKTWKVRSHDNGFIFARNNITKCNARDTLATLACEALGLDFGAVDIIEDKKGRLYVLEVNTAPGLEGQTIDSYSKAFREAYLAE